ncbi:MAG TPA: glutamate formimidoyltransferase [Candidatus Sulfomarinibacteraceae bacterium]|nr:glutamate formimidoyltransferase [Candidatus Sulfomarinibacteraceae bacterium]
MQQIIECVPNFSDGRRPEVYTAIADAIRSVSGINVLDVSADADHNRTVVTFVGDAGAVEEAAFRAIAKAAELINLDEHEGEHPRIGATDVVPFVPVRNATMEDCVQLAHRLGQRVGEELGITVYLYGEAATRPEREKLSNIRKGQYEKWRDEIGREPQREPDYGPAEAHSWGATVIGARPFLIAYNLYLNTSDVDKANDIARAVRASSGGLQNVQALGFTVEGQAQVSMNLLNFEKTPLPRVQELVKREAARRGLAVTKSELIGLAPQKALMDAAKWYLQLDDVEDEQILEYRVAQAQQEDPRAASVPHAFLDAVAGNAPTPGGGSVAALAGALGAALAQMMAGLTVGRKKYAGVESQVQELLEAAGEQRAALTQAITEDAKAFDDVMAAYRASDLSDEERRQAIEEATIHAGEVPLEVARRSRAVAELARDVARLGNANAVTDAAAGGIMARAAAEAAALNVRVNASQLQDQERAEGWRNELSSLLSETTALVDQLMEIATERGGF